MYRDEIFLFGSYFSIIYKIKFISKEYRRKIVRAFELISSFISRKKLSSFTKIISESEIVFASNYPGIPTDSIQKYIYKYLKESETDFVGVPICTWPYWYQSSIYPFDIFLVSTNNEYNQIINQLFHIRAFFFGCPSLDYKYLNSNASRKEKNDKKIAFIITNNNTNGAYIEWDQFNETKNISNALNKIGYEVRIKLHDRSSKRFKQKIYMLQNENIKITNEPIEIEVDKCDIAISYLSTGILKVIAKKIPAFLYLPKSLIYSNAFKAVSIVRRLYFESYEDNITRIDNMCIKVTSISELVEKIQNQTIQDYSLFEEQFNPNGASKRIVDYFLH